MGDNYTVLHLHTMFGNGVFIDSTVKFSDYVDKAKKCGMNAIAFTEHGSVFSWYKKKKYCDENNLKYIHGIEIYITETLDKKNRDNYHCCLYAKNFEGFKEINKLSSLSWKREQDNRYYYNPRITIDELINTSDNIIITSACISGILGKGNDTIKEKFINFATQNKHRCFLEIQHHSAKKQKEYNKYIYNLHLETGIRLTVGTDTHCLDETESRIILQKSKNIHFSDEEGWDLLFKDFESIIKCFQEQKIIPMDIIMEALENTNVISDMIEEFQIDHSNKYPHIYNNPEEIILKRISEGCKEKDIDENLYKERIQYELETYKKNDALQFLLLEDNIKMFCRKNNIRYGYSRGSVSGSQIAYLLDITNINSVKWNLSFERFISQSRVSLADIDTDYPPSKRDAVKKYLHSETGLNCCDIITHNTIAIKGAIRDCARALGINLEIVNEINKNIEINEYKYRKKYPELFKFVDILIGTIVSVGSHPAGVVTSDLDIESLIATFTTSSSNYPISQLDKNEIENMNWVKSDCLGLDNIELIQNTCELANIDWLTPDNMNFEDEKVWQSIMQNPCMIFQWESNFAHTIYKKLFSEETLTKIKNINPNIKYIDLFSMGNGALRPGGASYRDKMCEGIFNDNGHKALDDFLSDTLGYLVYQEQVMEFLNEFCGFTKGESDIIRRCIDENSLIMMSNGSYKKIKNILPGDNVISIGKNGNTNINKVNAVFNNGFNEVYEIITEHNVKICATKQHEFLTTDGYKKLQELSVGEHVLTPNKIFTTLDNLRPNQRLSKDDDNYIPLKIKSINKIGLRKVYDIEVENDHNYIANDIIVHNCIGKKDQVKLEEYLPKIRNLFIKTMNKRYGENTCKYEELITSFLKVIEDSSSYLFSKNHSHPYSMIGYACAWLRYYYPIEFICSALNIYKDKEEKTAEIFEYARTIKIKINSIKFRKSRSYYFIDKDNNTIYKGIASVKFMNEQVAEELYELRNENFQGSFINLLLVLKNTSINSRQLNILTKLGFWGSEFANANTKKLLLIIDTFDLLKQGDAKTFKKDKIPEHIRETVIKYSTDISEKTGKELKSYVLTDIKAIMQELEERICSLDIEDIDLKNRINNEIEYLGYIQASQNELERPYLYIKEVFPLKTRKDNKHFANSITYISIGSGLAGRMSIMLKDWKRCGEIKKNDIIICKKYIRNNQGYFNMIDYDYL